jgi:predicted type IV restriction endonuclease
MELENFKRTVSEIKILLSRPLKVHEPIVRQAIVLRILSTLGYNIWDIDEVSPEETNSGGYRPDFIIKVGNGIYVMELKASGTKIIPKHFHQAFNYIGALGIRYAILTNGNHWVFLDERLQGKYEERILFKIDIDGLSQDRFSDALSLALDRNTWHKDIFQTKIREIQSIISGEEYIDDEILFFGNTMGASARVTYNLTKGSWTILAGSTGLSRLTKYDDGTGNGLEKRRHRYLTEGRVIIRQDGFLEFMQDIVVTSASVAAGDIVGKNRDGWSFWKDANGNLAKQYQNADSEYHIKRRFNRHQLERMQIETEDISTDNI